MTDRCPTCEAFVKARSKRCVRCARAAKAAARLIQRAERALSKLRQTSSTEHWKLPRLCRSIAAHRRRLGIGRDRWELLVKAAFGAGTDALIDPRQMALFDAPEPACHPTASPSPSLSQSA